MSGDWSGENPLLLAHFNLMGIWPVLLGLLPRAAVAGPSVAFVAVCGRLDDDRRLLAAAVLRLRGGPAERVRRPDWTRWLTLTMGVMGAGLVAWGLLAGDMTDWIRQWRPEGLVFIMARLCGLGDRLRVGGPSTGVVLVFGSVSGRRERGLSVASNVGRSLAGHLRRYSRPPKAVSSSSATAMVEMVVAKSRADLNTEGQPAQVEPERHLRDGQSDVEDVRGTGGRAVR